MTKLPAALAMRAIPLRGAWSSTARPADFGIRLAAALAVAVSVGAGQLSQSSTEPGDAGASGRSEAGPAGGTQAAAVLPEGMIGVYTGAPYTYSSDVHVVKPGEHDFTAKDVSWVGRPFVDPIYYGVRLSRWAGGGNFAGMLDFTHSKAIAPLDQEVQFEGKAGGVDVPERGKLSELFRRLEFSHGHNMLTLNGLVALPRPHSRVRPYLGLGAGVSLPHSEVHLAQDPQRSYEYQYAGPTVQALFGFEFQTPRVSYFIEYKFTSAWNEAFLTHRDGSWLFVDLWLQAMRWWNGEAAPGGTVRTTLVSHQIIGGVALRISSR